MKNILLDKKNKRRQKMLRAEKFIKDQLRDLAVRSDCRAYEIVFANAIEGAEVLTRKELKKYIEHYLESLPNNLF